MNSIVTIDKKELGSVRYNFLKKIEKDLKDQVTIDNLYAPAFPDDEKRTGLKKALMGKTREEKSSEQYLMFNGSVKNQNFNHVIGFLCPIPTQHMNVIFQEHCYTIMVPHKIDSTIVYIEKRGSFKSTKGFFSVGIQVESNQVSEVDLFGQSSESSIGFKISDYLERLRFKISLEKELNTVIKEKQMSPICQKLNENKDLSKDVSKLVSTSEASQGVVLLRNPIGVTAILYPNGDNTIVQIGDFKAQPKTAFAVLNHIYSSLSSL